MTQTKKQRKHFLLFETEYLRDCLGFTDKELQEVDKWIENDLKRWKYKNQKI